MVGGGVEVTIRSPVGGGDGIAAALRLPARTASPRAASIRSCFRYERQFLDRLRPPFGRRLSAIRP